MHQRLMLSQSIGNGLRVCFQCLLKLFHSCLLIHWFKFAKVAWVYSKEPCFSITKCLVIVAYVSWAVIMVLIGIWAIFLTGKASIVTSIEDVILTFLWDNLERLIVDEMTLAKFNLRTPNFRLALLRHLHFWHVLGLGKTHAAHLL